jgi:AraC-like DNA-binding protein
MASADDSLCDKAHQPPPRDHKLCDAVDCLEELLHHGPLPAAEVQAAAEARGISYGTLRRAFRELGGQSLRQPRGATHQFLWQLDGRATTD